MTWALGILVFAAVLFVINRRAIEADKVTLRYTIGVNLGILKGELSRLAPLAKSLPADDLATADKHLSSIRSVVCDVEPRIATASRRALGEILRDVFSAMNESTELHRLLAKHSLVPTFEDLPLE
jgi:hypothetical protein